MPRVAEEITGLSSFSDSDSWPLISIEQAVEGLGGSVAAFRDVAQVFLDHLPKAAAALSGTHDTHTLLPVIHELASSLGTVGAIRAHRVARDIEARWRRGQVDDAVQSTAELKAVVAASVEALATAMAADR